MASANRALRGSLSLLLVLWTSVCALHAQDRPRWAMNLPDLPELPGQYQGLGTAKATDDPGADWQKASGQARGQILQQIRVSVMNRVTTRITETSSPRESSITDAFSSSTEQVATGTLEGLVVQRWFDDETKTLYAYGVISRAEVEMKIQEQLRQAAESASTYYGAAAKAVSTGDAQLALRSYLEAIRHVAFAEAYLGRTVVGDLRGRGAEQPVLPVLQSDLCALLNRIRFEVTGGNDQLAERGRALPLPLTGKVVYESTGGALPLRNAQLTASFVAPATGTLAPVSRTGENGEFALAATEVTGGDAVNKVRVTLAVSGMEALTEKLPDAVRCLAEASADFTVRLRTRASVSVAMHIVEYNLAARRAKSSVQEEIQKRLLGDRYAIIEESRMLAQLDEEKLNAAVRTGNFDAVVKKLGDVADVIVVGLVSTKERTNPTPGIFFSGGTAVVRAIDAKNGQILASVSLDNEKEGGASYEAAGTRLLRKMGARIGDELKTAIDGAVIGTPAGTPGGLPNSTQK